MSVFLNVNVVVFGNQSAVEKLRENLANETWNVLNFDNSTPVRQRANGYMFSISGEALASDDLELALQQVKKKYDVDLLFMSVVDYDEYGEIFFKEVDDADANDFSFFVTSIVDSDRGDIDDELDKLVDKMDGQYSDYINERIAKLT